MAEVAAGAGVALAAEEIVSTGVQAGVAGYMVAKPTMPLKVTFTMVANAEDDSTRRSLARSNHTLTVVGNKAYIFGGDTANDGIASTDIHVVTLVHSGKPEFDYSLIPAVSNVEGGKTPEARTRHSACAFNGWVAIYGGCDKEGQPIEDGSSIWFFDPEKTAWNMLAPADRLSTPGSRAGAKLFAYRDTIILYGGYDAPDTALSDVWQYSVDTELWSQLPGAPTATTSAALANGRLYLISGSDPMSSEFHYLDVSSRTEEATWATFTFPTNPIIPGPRPRRSGGFLPITTGYGRNYLVYFLGFREKPSQTVDDFENESHNVTQWSDMWTLQISSSDLEAKPSLSIGEAIKPAKIKDAIRSAFGAETGKHAWAEVEVQLPHDMQVPEGKLHPGPRGLFGCDVMEDGRTVVLWGGEDAKGERAGDGWIMKLE